MDTLQVLFMESGRSGLAIALFGTAGIVAAIDQILRPRQRSTGFIVGLLGLAIGFAATASEASSVFGLVAAADPGVRSKLAVAGCSEALAGGLLALGFGVIRTVLGAIAVARRLNFEQAESRGA